MNKIHNIIWSKTQNAFVVVAEGTKAASKAGGAALKVMIALIMLSPVAGMAASLPQGGSISVGQGSIVSNGSNQMVIKQTTDKLGINWQSFNVGADGHVVFDQPGAHSIALNRVIGSDGSAILGKIDSNGQVFLINPNGVIFGKDAKINVGGLVASTLNISDADFQAGNFKFIEGATSGEVTNLGSIEASQGGYVALIGKSVKNNGVIKAKLGTAAMAAGNAVTLDFAGDGLVNIQVKESAVNALVENKGLIKADGGNVLMTARASNALLNTVVNNDGVIEAQTLGSRAGKIFLDGGTDSGTVQVAGTLDASAPVSGNGGFVETSGAHVKVADGAKITTLSTQGKTGDWLVDPTDFTISNGVAAQTASGIGATTLESSLASTNVTLQTAAAGTENGDINVNADVTWSANTTLTLDAHNDININANINVNGDSGGLDLKYGSNGAVTTAKTKLASGKFVNLNGANTTYAENGESFIVIHNANDLLQLDDVSKATRKFVLATDIDASDTVNWNGGLGYNPAGRNADFEGALNGLNHTLSNLYINRPTEDHVGLFGDTRGADISNINVSGSVIGADYTGMIVGYGFGNLENIKVNGSVVGHQWVGGIAGYQSGRDGLWGHTGHGVFNNLKNYASVSSASDMGGLFGVLQYGSLQYGVSAGSLTATNGSNIGGLIGKVSNGSSIDHSYSNVSVSGQMNNIGGLVGQLSDGSTISNSFATGNVQGDVAVGGLVGKLDSGGKISTSYASGDVTGTGLGAGGLVGHIDTGEVDHSFTTSKVVGHQYVGGLAGISQGVSNISYTYSSGSVQTDSFGSTGGFIGYSVGTTLDHTYSNTTAVGFIDGGLIGDSNSDTILDTYWNTNLANKTAAQGNGGVGKTNVQMKTAATYAGWDVATQGGSSSTWRIYDGLTTPMMRMFMGSGSVSTTDPSVTYLGRNLTAADIGSHGSISSVVLDPFWSLSPAANTNLLGGYTSSGNFVKNAGTYALDYYYSNPYGLDLTQTTKSNLTINKAVLHVSGVGGNKTYDGSNAATVTYTNDQLGSDWLTITGTSNFVDKNAGTGKTINVTGLATSGFGAANYVLDSTSLTTTADIAKATLAVTASGVNKTYDGTTSATVNLSDNRFGSDVLVLGSSTPTFANKNVGNGKALSVTGITVTGADAGNYTWNTTTSTTANITKAALAVTATGVNKTYDRTTTAGVTLSDNRFGSDVLVVSESGKAFSNKNVGTGKAISVTGITVTGADSGNYTWNTTAATTADITKAALNVSATGVNKTYDGTTTAGATLADNRIGADDLAITASGKDFVDKNAGTAKAIDITGISVTGTDSGNYSWNTTASTTANITKAALTVTAAGVNKTYDGSTAAGANLADDRIGSDVLVLSSTAKNFADKNAGAGKTINVTGINVAGADAINYTWNTTAVTSADIAKAALTVTASGVNKTYDGTTGTSVSLGDDRFVSDDLTLSSTGQAFADKNAGTSKAVNVTGINVMGTDAGNYTWNTSAITSADIAKAALNISATGINKTYDGSTLAGVTFNDDRIGSDALIVGAGSNVFTDKNAGIGKSIAVNGITVTGADAGNYSWNTMAMATADIAKASLVVRAQNGNKVEGDADGVLNWNIQSGSLFGSDSINGALARDAGEVVGQYAINRGTLDAGMNYDLAFVAGTYEVTAAGTPPVVIPPVVTPPVMPPVTPPVVVDPITPPVVVPPKPPVSTEPTAPTVNFELEQTKEIIANITVATKAPSNTDHSAAASSTSARNPLGDYRLINLGMKLPEDMTQDENTTK